MAEIFGIAVSVHPSFLLLVVWFAVAYWLEVGSLGRVASGVALFLLLFGCVLLHELGHALTARRFGVVTREITLLPIGGIATLERSPQDPAQSLWITLAGPAVNVVIAGALFVIVHATGQWQPLRQVNLIDGPFLERLMVVNVSLVVFNLLPAFPMDGGRALRALLAMRMDDRRAMHIAARLGQIMAIVFAIVGWMTNPMLLLIALFVWAGATQETRAADIRAALTGVPVARVMITAFTTLTPEDPLASAVALLQHGGRQSFPVLRGGRLVGVLTQDDVLRGLAAAGPQSSVGDALDRDVLIVHPRDPVDAVLSGLDARPSATAAVVQDGQLVGLLTADAIVEFLTIQEALEHKAA